MLKKELYKNLDRLIKLKKSSVSYIYQSAKFAEKIQISEDTLQKLVQARELQLEKEKNSNFFYKFFYWMGDGFKYINDIFSDMAFFNVLDYLSRLSILLGIILFFWEIPARQAERLEEERQVIYQSWEIIRDVQPENSDTEKLGTDLIIALEALNKADQSLKEINLSGAQLSNAGNPLNLAGVWAQKAIFDDASLNRATFNNAKLGSNSFVGANLRNSSFRGANLYNTNFENAILSGANFRGGDHFFSGIDAPTMLKKVNFKDADLSEANLSRSDLAGANFEGADLNYADFSQSNLAEAIFDGANLEGTDLRNVSGLTALQIRNANNLDKALLAPQLQAELLPEK